VSSGPHYRFIHLVAMTACALLTSFCSSLAERSQDYALSWIHNYGKGRVFFGPALRFLAAEAPSKKDEFLNSVPASQRPGVEDTLLGGRLPIAEHKVPMLGCAFDNVSHVVFEQVTLLHELTCGRRHESEVVEKP